MTRAPFEEIGWLEVELTEAGRRLDVFAGFPERFTTLQWHGDTFSIPPEPSARRSPRRAQPGLLLRRRAGLGLQFHLEETRETLGELVDVARADAARSAGDSRHSRVGPPLRPRALDRPLDYLLAPDAPFDACASCSSVYSTGWRRTDRDRGSIPRTTSRPKRGWMLFARMPVIPG